VRPGITPRLFGGGRWTAFGLTSDARGAPAVPSAPAHFLSYVQAASVSHSQGRPVPFGVRSSCLLQRANVRAAPVCRLSSPTGLPSQRSELKSYSCMSSSLRTYFPFARLPHGRRAAMNIAMYFCIYWLCIYVFWRGWVGWFLCGFGWKIGLTLAS